jgi:hypothetical protein
MSDTHLVEVENNVELADVAKILVQQLDEQVNGLHQKKLVIIYIHSKYEKDTGISPINNFKILVL